MIKLDDWSNLTEAQGLPQPVSHRPIRVQYSGHVTRLGQQAIRPVLPVHHLGPRDDDVDDDGGRHQERGRGAGDGENIPVALFSETVLKVKVC